MKKLGTPIGAGPGSESEKVGLDAWGTPLPVGPVVSGFVVPGVVEAGFFDLAGAFFCCFLGLFGFCVVGGVWVDFCWGAPGLGCFGGGGLLLVGGLLGGGGAI